MDINMMDTQHHHRIIHLNRSRFNYGHSDDDIRGWVDVAGKLFCTSYENRLLMCAGRTDS